MMKVELWSESAFGGTRTVLNFGYITMSVWSRAYSNCALHSGFSLILELPILILELYLKIYLYIIRNYENHSLSKS